MNPDGSNLIKLTDAGGSHPAWVLDGSKIAYCDTVDGRSWIMGPDGSNEKQLTFK
jgi:Tol biopolymer transport system component